MPTELTLLCLVLGDPIHKAFAIDIMDTQTVGHLKKLIVGDTVNNFELKDVVLFKVEIPPNDDSSSTEDDLIPLLNSLSLNEQVPLKGARKLANVFRDVPEEHIHVLVKVPSYADPPNRPQVLSVTAHEVTKARTAFLEARKRVAPSSAGQASEFQKHQLESDETIPCNRPYGATETIPATLLHPIFGQFKDDCEALTPTREDNALALKLQEILSNFYGSKDARALAVRTALADAGIVLERSFIENTNFNTDGDARSADRKHRFNLAEFNNELGSRAAEPYLQASIYYLESTRDYAGQMPHSVLPCIVLLVFGPHMYFAGAAWNGSRPTIQVLSPALSFHMHHSDITLRTMVARHLGAYRRAHDSLRHYYDIELPNIDPSAFPSRVTFPYPTEFTALDGKKRSFSYVSQLDPDKLLFFGKIRDGGDDLCIKFSRSYSRETHELCASLDTAPRLQGLDKIAGGWYMIVMDRIDTEYSSYDEFRTSPALNDARLLLLHRAIGKGLKAVHDKGYVHGDIRNVNLMVAKNGEAKFRFIDFDWAGKEGTARYPMNVYTGRRLWRPDGAYDGELITFKHDEKMIEKIIGTSTSE